MRVSRRGSHDARNVGGGSLLCIKRAFASVYASMLLSLRHFCRFTMYSVFFDPHAFGFMIFCPLRCDDKAVAVSGVTSVSLSSVLRMSERFRF